MSAGRRATVMLVALVLALGWPQLVRGGEYHVGATLLCYDCHTMHFSMQHGFDGGTVSSTAAPDGDWLGSSGPNPTLLKAPTSQVCLACHDGQTFAPDVRGANTGSHVRQAGALPTGATPYEDWKGHLLGSTTHPPGNPSNCSYCHGSGHPITVPPPLRCNHCHDHHGNEYYRNLGRAYAPGSGGFPGVTYAKGTNDLSRHVFVRSFTVGEVATNYAVASVDLNEPDSTRSGMGEWCGQCHGRFHGKQGDSNMGGTGGRAWLRHPTADVNIGAQGGDRSSLAVFRTNLYRVKVMSPTGDWGAGGAAWPGAPSTLTPTCTTCHKAHGNRNPFGLIYLTGTQPITEEGDGTNVRDLCGQCHRPGD